VENTYFVNTTLKEFPADPNVRRSYELKYYQWMPYIFFFEAVLCYAPKMLFKVLYSWLDLTVIDVMQYAWQKIKDPKQGRIDHVTYVNEYCDKVATSFISMKKRESRVVFVSYLTTIYLLMKIVAICSIILQLVILQYFISADSILWGFGLIRDFINGADWRVTGYFPRVTFCDLQTRDLGQQRPHTIQCVLILNMFIEKIYLFLWAWFLFTLVLTTINLLWWVSRIVFTNRRVQLIDEALAHAGVKDRDTRDIKEFVTKYLKSDGIVALKLIEANVGFIAMADVCKRLWDNYFQFESKSE